MAAARQDPNENQIVGALLDRYPKTYAEQMGLKLRDTPSPLFRLLCMSLLMSARISSDIAMRAGRALAREGWTTAKKMVDSTWARRTRTLNEAGYARYDERTSTMLADTAQMLMDDYGGDLRRLRVAADHDPDEERRLLKRFKGIGDTGADIFLREAQAVWDEVAPFADRRALRAAGELGLGNDARALFRLVDGPDPARLPDLARLMAALVHVELDGTHDEVLAAAGS